MGGGIIIIDTGEKDRFDALALCFKRRSIGGRQHRERLIKNDMDAAERLGDDKMVPSIQAPCSVKAHMDGNDGSMCGLGDFDQARMKDIARSPWTVGRDAHIEAIANGLFHADECGHRAPR